MEAQKHQTAYTPHSSEPSERIHDKKVIEQSCVHQSRVAKISSRSHLRNSTYEEASLGQQTVQPGWVRITHWINALAVVVMVTSGWQIYDASPIFKSFTFPASITLGGWLGGALQWHFAAMWLLVGNFIVYVALNVGDRPLSPQAVAREPEARDRRSRWPHCAASSPTMISPSTTRCRNSPISP